MRSWVLNKSFEAVARVKEQIQVCCWGTRSKSSTHCPQSPNSGLLSLTGDTWTTKSGKCFMSVTSHWIGASIECPSEWQLHSAQLGFAEVDGHHSGANLAQLVVRIIDRYDAREKVCYSIYCA
jgi:hypothetical protein